MFSKFLVNSNVVGSYFQDIMDLKEKWIEANEKSEQQKERDLSLFIVDFKEQVQTFSEFVRNRLRYPKDSREMKIEMEDFSDRNMFLLLTLLSKQGADITDYPLLNQELRYYHDSSSELL